MGLFGSRKNSQSAQEIVNSMQGVFLRVPRCIYGGYFAAKNTPDNVVDVEALISAIYGTEIQVYERSEHKLEQSPTFDFAMVCMSQMKDGDEKTKITHASYSLILAEMIKGGSGVSEELGAKAVQLGFTQISEPAIEELFKNQ